MATIYFDKMSKDGVQVVQVGKSQMWDWCAWSKLGYQGTLNNSERIICFAESLRKGAYVVMELSYTFSWIDRRPHAVASFTSLRQALSAVMDYDFYDTNVSKHQTHWATGNRVMHAYEVWHIVDDAELWQVWEHDSAIACKMGGQEDSFHLYDGCNCVLDLGRYVPDTVYVITYIKDWDNDSIDRSDWYKDANDWVDAICNAECNGLVYLGYERQTADELGLYVVDDWDMDEGLADGMTVLNAYFRVSVS